MARPRKPIELIVAQGKSHMVKEEIERRRAQEIRVPFTDVAAPEYLPEALKKEFNDISSKLLQIGVMTELDEDCLARYLLSKQSYLQYTSLVNKAMRNNNMADIERLSVLQDKAFKQTRSCAMDLGLTISSRARLVMPYVEPPKENKFLQKFGG